MRSVIIATISFIILIACTAANSIFILTEISNLADDLEEVPEIDALDCFDRLQHFEKKWTSFKKTAALTLSHSELNKISCYISELYVHLKNSNDIDFDNTLVMLGNALDELSRTEKLSFESIF